MLRTLLSIETRTPDPTTPSPIENRKSKIENCLDFISSDSTLDRYSEIISPSGWRLETYLRNPVFQNAHQYGDIIFTLGRALITEVRTIEVASGQARQVLFQRIQFAVDANPMAKIAYALYAGGYLRAVSVGFLPLRWLDANGTEHSTRSFTTPTDPAHSISPTPETTPPQIKNQKSKIENPARLYLEQDLLEVSAVAIPANPNALALAYKSGALEKSDLKETADLLHQLTSTTASPIENQKSKIENPSTLAPSEPSPMSETFSQTLSDHPSTASPIENQKSKIENPQTLALLRALHKILCS
jgi:hypothetical protein